jgi:hypothetical protein
MYLSIDYNYFVNQHYHKTKIICKKKQGDFDFALQSSEGDFSRYRVRISSASPGLVSPGDYSTLHFNCPRNENLNLLVWIKIIEIIYYIYLNKNWKIYWSEQSFIGLGLEDRCSSWQLYLDINSSKGTALLWSVLQAW